MSLHTLKSALFSLFFTCILSACGSSEEESGSNNFNPSLTFTSNVEIFEGEVAVINFNLDKSTLHDVSFDYQIIEDSAKSGIDFQTASGSIIIESGKKSTNIEVITIDNITALANANFQILISNVKGAKITDKIINIVIIDNEPQLIFDNKYQVLEGNQVNITLTLSEAVQRRVAVHYETADSSAKAGVDYKAADSVIYFEPGERNTTVTLTTLVNESHDDLSFYFKVSSIIGASETNTESLINVNNNEPRITFPNNFYIEEGNAAKIVFTINGSINHDIKLKYDLYAKTNQDGTPANGAASMGKDFLHSSEVLNLINTYDEDGKLVYKTTLPLYSIANKTIQPDRDFFFKVLELKGATTDIEQVRITITDAIETVKIAFNEINTQASYQAGNLSISLTKSLASTEELIIPFELTGTAIEGEDYTFSAANNEIAFAANSTTATIDLNIIDNGLPRSGSTISFFLKPVGSNEIDEEQSSHTVVLAGNLALNDTGATTEDDARYGRDSNANLNNDEDGKSGFSFTKIDTQGNKLNKDASSFSCVMDNVTGLVYETKEVVRGTAYNAKLSDNEITQLGVSLATVSYRQVYDAFTDDFTNITGLKWDDLSDTNKAEAAFKLVIELTSNEVDVMLTASTRTSGLNLKYPFNLAQLELHHKWRSNEHVYYWLNEDNKTNGGRAGSVGEFDNTKYPISRQCALPHEEMTNYVADIKGCNSSDYLKVMNDLAVCGYTDWRLPEVEELRSIVNYDLTNPTWDAKFIPNSSSLSDYISASPSVSNDASTWCVSGQTGEVKLCHKQLPHFIRAVRGAN